MIPSAIKKIIQEPLEGLFGRASTWHRHRLALKSRPTVEQALLTLRERWGLDSSGDGDDPILIFSAGWRSGSTLLQRLALSGNEALIWGEPYPYCDYIRSMASSLTSFTANTPPDQFILPESTAYKEVDPSTWTACMYPHPQHVLRAHRAFFQALYRDPARARGYSRWGLKEVVLSTQDAAYLSWLFPAAKFVFLFRNPYDAYRSYRSFGDWYYRWPDKPVFTARQFGIVWRRLLEDFLSDHKSLNGILLRYEDLCVGSLCP